MLIEQLIDLTKVKSENLKFRTEIVLCYGWLVSNTVDDYFELQITKEIFKSKIEACLVNASL